MSALFSKAIAGGLAAVIIWIIYYVFTIFLPYLIKKISGKKSAKDLQNKAQTDSSLFGDSEDVEKAIDNGSLSEKKFPKEESHSETHSTNLNTLVEESLTENMNRCHGINQSLPLPDKDYPNSMSKKDRNRIFKFSKKQRIFLLILGMISILVIVTFFLIQKYDFHYSETKECYNISIILASGGLVLIPLIWWICCKQDKKSKVWRIYLVRILNILTCLTVLISLGFMLTVLFSNDFKISKEDYAHNDALRSNDINILNKELIRRYEDDGISLSYDFSTETHSLPSDKDFFSIIKFQAQNNNAVAQGILGEFYFEIGRSLISNSKKENGYIQDERLYNYGKDKIERAYYWWLKAAENEDSRGMYRIGNCYAQIIKIDGIEKDLEKAYNYWMKSANKGFGMAYKRLGDLFGTWDYLGAFQICMPTGIGNDTVECLKGIDVYYKNGEEYFSQPFPLPKEWKHNIKKAREYWEKAVECGGLAETQARERLEKIYPEEK